MLPTVLIIHCCITNWAQIEWLKITAIICFSHGSAIWAGLSRNSFSLLHSAGAANKGKEIHWQDGTLTWLASCAGFQQQVPLQGQWLWFLST